jgi:hypothetical protein
MAPERSTENPAKNDTAFRNLMEHRPAYEQLISGKLELLPVPDMADAIWARIERQLDIDLPTDGGNNGPVPTKPSGPGALGWGLSIFVVALITAFLLYKKEPQTGKPANQNLPAATEQIQQPAQNTTAPPLPGRTTGTTNTEVRKEPANQPLNPAPDSIVQQPVVSAPLHAPDSVKTLPAEPLVKAPTAADSVQTSRKKRGVSGITDADYRIVPTKKDSS